MPLYRYEAVAASGELVTGEMEAPGEDTIVDRLHAQGNVPIRVEPAGRGLSWSRALTRPIGGKRGRRSANLALLTQQLATLLGAGLALDRTLEIAQSVVGQKHEQMVLRDVLALVRGGSSLADAMAAQGGFFPSFYIGMVRAGEAGGSLDATLRHLGEFLERSQAAREQVRSALTYPMIVLVTGCASMGVLFGFVIPGFRPLFEEAGAALPVSASLVLGIADLFRDWWGVMAGIVALAGLLGLQQARNPASRRRWDSAILRIPVIGEIATQIAVSRFARTLGTLLKNGVAPLIALSITAEAIGNIAIREAVAGLADSVKQGKGLAEPLARTPLMPRLLVQLVRVGEETARLEEMLIKLAEIYDQETRRNIERLLAMLVPAITIAMGAVVALVISTILTAILSVYDLAI
jgi:general secretion pathway protein F